MTPEAINILAKHGLGFMLSVGIFGLCAWIVKFMVMRMTIILDKLVEKLEKHDRNASERGRFIKEEHERIINSLKEVQTALGRINGYKHEE